MSECGFPVHCSRPPGHTGKHAGWRTGFVGLAARPFVRDNGETLGKPLTRREAQSAVECIYHGSRKDAAVCMGLSEHTVRNYLRDAFAKTGAGSVVHLAYVLGWVTLPMAHA